ncbi:hypothetical protein [Ralstonia syzygii]|nr:hypothetical protein [Ralstonia syzygii]
MKWIDVDGLQAEVDSDMTGSSFFLLDVGMHRKIFPRINDTTPHKRFDAR